MKISLIVLVITCLFACNALKKVSRKKEIRHEQQYREKKLQVTDSMKFVQESSNFSSAQINSKHVVEIIPIGSFTYSAAEGFRGEARQVRVKGNTRQIYVEQLDSAVVLNTGSTLKDDQEMAVDRIEKTTTLDKSVKRPALMGMVVLGIIVLIFIVKRRL